jgi:dephospho-CoA kinase
MPVYGLTGGIATGKSFVARCFAELGATVVSADDWARQAVVPGSPGLEAVLARFGAACLLPNGELDRAALAARIFADPQERRALEAILHPRIHEIGRAALDRVSAAQPGTLVIAEIPLLFETGRDWGLAGTILVYAPATVQVARLVARDGVTAEEARTRLAAQLPIDTKRGRADHVIDNGGDRDATERQVRELYTRICGGKSAGQ